MFLIVTLIIIASISYFLYERKHRETNSILSKFSSPPAWSILGHGPHLAFKKNYEILEVVWNFNKTQPPIWWLHAPFISVIYINDLKIIETLLSNTKYNDKSFDYNLLIPWLGTGLLIANGQKWHQRRKIITPAFHFKILEQFVEIMENHGEVFIEKLKKLNGREVDVFPIISLYALDIICEAAMGYQLDSQNNNEQEYANAIKKLTQNYYYVVFDFLTRLKFLPKSRRMAEERKELIEKIHKFTLSVINDRKKVHAATNFESSVDEFGRKQKLAFLDLLLQSKIDGEPLSDEGLREEVDTFMFEGHDTTTSAISFTLHNLAKYPEIQTRVYEECCEVFGDRNSTKMQDLNSLSYLEKVIKESLRLYPPVPAIARGLQKPEIIEGVMFPANVNLKIPILFLGRNPDLFPDPLKFDPSRFEKEENIKLFSYIPFAAGSRNCIGQKFAMLELKSILSKVVRNFEITVSKENEKIILAPALVLRSLNGINLSFNPRK